MDRTVLITGGSTGIGRATAEAFLEEGWTVIVTARDESTIRDLGARGARTETLDVTKPAQCESVVEAAVDATGRLDCLVNNAGYAQFGTLEDVPTRLVADQFDVNVFGPHRLIRAALPVMREAENGTIVNVSSVAARLAAPGMGVYGGSKAALEAMSDALRVEAASYDVDVSLVEPGPVDTQFDAKARDSLADTDRREAYGDVYDALSDWQVLANMTSISPEAVADVILEATLSPNPQARYVVGPGSKYLAMARFLPDRVRDAIFSLVRRIAG
jgi:Short-chain dehydrogenases of various substrate specificities